MLTKCRYFADDLIESARLARDCIRRLRQETERKQFLLVAVRVYVFALAYYDGCP